MKEFIIKTRNGFERENGCARYKYDNLGKYLGQYQPDMLSEDAGAGELWLATYAGDKCYHELTKEQMANAE